jgi:hypothetical protein
VIAPPSEVAVDQQGSDHNAAPPALLLGDLLAISAARPDD